jgi:hypothetical protein
MNITDKLNFRGKFKQYDVDGKPYLYLIGDTVDYQGKKYVAVKPTSTKIPGTQEGGTFWKSTGGNFGFYIQEDVPAYVEVGDRWYVPSTGILYTYIKEESNKFWIEL